MENGIKKFNDKMAMTTNEIAIQTGKRHDTILEDTERMLTELYGIKGCHAYLATYVTKGKTHKCYNLPKNEVLTLVSGYSIPLRAKIIRRLDELETKPASPTQIENYSLTKAHLDLEMLAQTLLKTSDASRLMIAHGVYKEHGISTKYLPQYTEKVKITFAAKDLLNKKKCGISSRAFNVLMMSAGYLEEKQRSSTKHPDKVKKYKALTDKGLEFGQNDTSTHNTREVQPHYFEDTFTELFRLINL